MSAWRTASAIAASTGSASVRQAIVDPQALAARVDQPGLAQIGQVPRRLRLRNLQALVDVADADLAGQQQPEDAQPGRVGERLEQAFPSRPVAWSYIRLDKYITDTLQFLYSFSRIHTRSSHMSDIQQAVREKYGAIADVGDEGARPTSAAAAARRPAAAATRSPRTSTPTRRRAACPADAVTASLGCGNPTALLALEPGQTVLDLGSGGGIDVLLSAKRVGPTGKAYGLDMTDEMLALARENQRKAGATNVEFLKGTIEAIPLPDNSVDVIISNCVINLSSDKDAVLREAFRVLKPGGRFAVSDVVVRGDVPADVRRNMELWVGCIAGALEETEYAAKLRAAGFADVEVEPWRVYNVDDARAFLTETGLDVDRRAAGEGQVRQRVRPRAQAGPRRAADRSAGK